MSKSKLDQHEDVKNEFRLKVILLLDEYSTRLSAEEMAGILDYKKFEMMNDRYLMDRGMDL